MNLGNIPVVTMIKRIIIFVQNIFLIKPKRTQKGKCRIAFLLNNKLIMCVHSLKKQHFCI